MKIIKTQRAIILDGFGIKPAHFDETTATNLLNLIFRCSCATCFGDVVPQKKG